MAHLRTLATTQDPNGRLRWKLQLIRALYERNYSQQDILELFRLLDWMMRLPNELEIQFRDEVRRFEEEKNMQYVTSIERIGREEGLLEGRQQGRQEEREAVIFTLLKSRFGKIDGELSKIVEQLVQMQPDEFTPLLLTLSRDELIERFTH
ncbi:MAG: hypothetical protein HC899_38220 [Leptolyngbyaceae cyanobacterium SM1_4_3]|nr:hypothetical protein [Leptolyngbyaceae cyanobacterium SM1_4_3]